MKKRAIIIVIDSMGIGALPDCKEFGKVASQEMAGDIAKLISSEVHDFVKEMMITVNNAPVLPTVVSPMGPCTGTLTIMPTFFQIS